MKGSHKTQTCMPLKPVTIRDCGGVVQFFAEIIGAVTHVFVDDPTRGYGIFIENMLEE